LKVDNASITGESIPLIRTANIPQTGSVIHAKNMVFFSTNVIEGTGCSKKIKIFYIII